MTKTMQVRRFDFGQITSIEKTPQGFLKVPGFATRTGVFPYVAADGKVRRELRHPDDVMAPESLITLKNAPVTNEHPPEMVTPENYEKYSVGYTTDRVEVNRDMVEADLIIADVSAIKAVEEDGKRELSAGYVADLEEEEGVYNGVPYNYRQKNIRYNHVAIVDRGRAGPEVRLRMDSADAEMVNGEGMNEKLVISGEEVELPAHLAAVVRDMLDRYDEMRAKLSQLEESMKKDAEMEPKKDVDVAQGGIGAKVPEVQGAPDGKSAGAKVDAEKEEEEKKDEEKEEKTDSEKLMDAMAKVDALQAKVDEMSSKSEGKQVEGKMDSAQAIRVRVKLERHAEKLVPAEVVEKFDAMSDDEIRAAVIKHRHPKADLVGKSSVYLQSRFDSIVETITESVVTRREMGRSLLEEKMDSAEMDPNAARKKMIEASKSLYTSPLAANRK